MASPKFTEEFNVAEPGAMSDWAPYRKFIDKLRTKLGVTKSHGLPVLTPQKEPPPSDQWFDIVLRTKTQSIKLRIRRDNLYLGGYQMHNSNQWLEFGKDRDPHLISGSSFLGFGGSYTEMANTAKKKVEEVKLGQKALTHAVDNLAVATSSASRADSLIVVIQMICESIRYARLSNYFSETYKGEGEPPAGWMIFLHHAWEDLSKALLRADANPAKFFDFKVPKSVEKDLKIKSHLDAVAILGILLKA